MVRVVNFESGGGENIISRVAEQVTKINEKLEMKDASHEVIVKESLKSIAQSISPQSVSPTSSVVNDTVETNSNSVFPSYLNKGINENDSKKIETLVNIAFEKNLDEAINLSKKESPFIEDAFHDALTEKLVPELKKRGVFN